MGKGKPRKVNRYSNEFKITAIKLAGMPHTLIKDVAETLGIHPFMLSRWKKEYREGKIEGAPHADIEKLVGMEKKVRRQNRIRELEKALQKAKIENDLLKKAIAFDAERRRMPSPLLDGIVKTTPSPSSVDTMASPAAVSMHGKNGR
jgi:transposase